MSQPKTQQPLFWLNLGAAFEYYDFSVYALLAATIGQRFFANFSNPTISAFFLFVIGYLARPLGGWLFAKFGDVYGRRPSIIASSTILAAATLLLAATPTANQTLAVAWLTSCRLIQGICWGAEVPSVSTLIFEAKHRHRCISRRRYNYSIATQPKHTTNATRRLADSICWRSSSSYYLSNAAQQITRKPGIHQIKICA